MKTIQALILILLVYSVSSCTHRWKRVKGNGKITTENRNVQSADRIRLAGSMNVILAKGATSVKVEADENLMTYIEIVEEDGWLKIGSRRGISFVDDNAIKVFVTTPTLTQVSVSGSGDVSSDTKFDSDDAIKFSVAGSGDVRVPLHAPKVSADIAGSGNIILTGETRDVSVSIAGSGYFDGQALKAEAASVSISGSGDALVFADAKLKANIAGSGGVKYLGNPAISKSLAGSGTVSRIGE